MLTMNCIEILDNNSDDEASVDQVNKIIDGNTAGLSQDILDAAEFVESQEKIKELVEKSLVYFDETILKRRADLIDEAIFSLQYWAILAKIEAARMVSNLKCIQQLNGLSHLMALGAWDDSQRKDYNTAEAEVVKNSGSLVRKVMQSTKGTIDKVKAGAPKSQCELAKTIYQKKHHQLAAISLRRTLHSVISYLEHLAIPVLHAMIKGAGMSPQALLEESKKPPTYPDRRGQRKPNWQEEKEKYGGDVYSVKKFLRSSTSGSWSDPLDEEIEEVFPVDWSELDRLLTDFSILRTKAANVAQKSKKEAASTTWGLSLRKSQEYLDSEHVIYLAIMLHGSKCPVDPYVSERVRREPEIWGRAAGTGGRPQGLYLRSAERCIWMELSNWRNWEPKNKPIHSSFPCSIGISETERLKNCFSIMEGLGAKTNTFTRRLKAQLNEMNLYRLLVEGCQTKEKYKYCSNDDLNFFNEILFSGVDSLSVLPVESAFAGELLDGCKTVDNSFYRSKDGQPKMNPFVSDILLVQVNLGQHWYLMVFCGLSFCLQHPDDRQNHNPEMGKDRCVLVLDSIEPSNKHVPQVMEYLNKLSQVVTCRPYDCPISTTTFPVFLLKTPRQPDAWMCGFWTMAFTSKIVCGVMKKDRYPLYTDRRDNFQAYAKEIGISNINETEVKTIRRDLASVALCTPAKFSNEIMKRRAHSCFRRLAKEKGIAVPEGYEWNPFSGEEVVVSSTYKMSLEVTFHKGYHSKAEQERTQRDQKQENERLQLEIELERLQKLETNWKAQEERTLRDQKEEIERQKIEIERLQKSESDRNNKTLELIRDFEGVFQNALALIGQQGHSEQDDQHVRSGPNPMAYNSGTAKAASRQERALGLIGQQGHPKTDKSTTKDEQHERTGQNPMAYHSATGKAASRQDDSTVAKAALKPNEPPSPTEASKESNPPSRSTAKSSMSPSRKGTHSRSKSSNSPSGTFSPRRKLPIRPPPKKRQKVSDSLFEGKPIWLHCPINGCDSRRHRTQLRGMDDCSGLVVVEMEDFVVLDNLDARNVNPELKMKSNRSFRHHRQKILEDHREEDLPSVYDHDTRRGGSRRKNG